MPVPAILLLLLLSACSPPSHSDPGSGLPSDGGTGSTTDGGTGSTTDGGTGSTSDSGTTSTPDPWLDDTMWREAGPNAALLDMSIAPTTPHWETWITTSVDGRDYDSPAKHLAHTFSSLDLMVWQDHVLIVSGSTEHNTDLGIDAPWESVFVLYTLDLKTWGTGIWPVDDTEFELLTDPALHVADNGDVQVVYYARSGDSAITPPDLVPGEHDIKMADRSGDTFVERSDRVYADEYLVDPVCCAWDGVDHLFATRDWHVSHAVRVDGQFVADESFQWDQQVPFCFDQDGQHKVIAQASGGTGEPTIRTLQDDASFSEAEPFFDGDDPFGGGCTSPVVGFFQDRWVMLCAVWVD